VAEAAHRIREFTTWKVFAPTADDVLAASQTGQGEFLALD
jgi:hypothetical protein